MRLLFLAIALTIVGACTTARVLDDSSDRNLRNEAIAFYDRYSAALRAGERTRLAQFYSPQGALLVINGQRMRMTHAGIDSIYRGPGWSPPVFFEFQDLDYEELPGRQVLVTGRFRWLRAANADTGRFVYLAIVQPVDSGVAIRLEHETQIGR